MARVVLPRPQVASTRGCALVGSSGVPVGTLAIGKAGAVNAGLLAAAILATADDALAERLKAWRARQTEGVAEEPI